MIYLRGTIDRWKRSRKRGPRPFFQILKLKLSRLRITRSRSSRSPPSRATRSKGMYSLKELTAPSVPPLWRGTWNLGPTATIIPVGWEHLRVGSKSQLLPMIFFPSHWAGAREQLFQDMGEGDKTPDDEWRDNRTRNVALEVFVRVEVWITRRFFLRFTLKLKECFTSWRSTTA